MINNKLLIFINKKVWFIDISGGMIILSIAFFNNFVEFMFSCYPVDKTVFMKKILLLFILFYGLDVFSCVYPISPRPLRKLVIESEACIIGEVLEVYMITMKNVRK